MNALAKPRDAVQMHPNHWRNRLMGPLTQREDEGELEVLTFKVPAKLKARIDAAAKETGNNRTQTMLSLMRWALDEYEAQKTGEGRKAGKGK